MSDNTINPLVPFGAGIGVGVLSLFALIELFPLLVLGGAGYLIFKGLNTTNPKEDTDTCRAGAQQK